MADDDTFDIDIYGDDDQGVEQEQSENLVQQGSTSTEANGGPLSNRERALDEQGGDPKPEATATDRIQQADPNGVDTSSLHDDPGMHLDGQSMDNTPFGTEERDSRPVDVDATKAVIVSDLQWWVNDDDIRGWTHFCGTEDELQDITFSEHKVNGKCKGQVYVEFLTPAATTAFKRLIESESSPNTAKPASKKYPINYSSPGSNPFKTLPKDAPGRQAASSAAANTTPGAIRGAANSSPYERQAGFQRGRGGFRGGRGGFNQGSGMNGGFNNSTGGGGFNRGGVSMMGRGGFQGGRGGRGGFGGANMNGGMMSMPNMMGMGGMPMMGNMMGMGGFNPMQGQFNPGFFQGQQGSQGGDNPHGAKRLRQDG